MTRRSSWILGAFSLAFLLSCGGDETPTGNGGVGALTPTPAPTAAATATATAAPTASPTPIGPAEDANPGPVVRVKTKLFIVRKSQGGEAREGNGGQDPYYDERSNTDVVFVGEFFIIDTTPFNAQNQKCQANAAPQWNVQHGGKFEPLGNNGIGSNPFQYRANARARGVVSVNTFVDGVQSNTINIEIR